MKNLNEIREFPTSILRFNIDNEWHLNDIENLFGALKNLYQLDLAQFSRMEGLFYNSKVYLQNYLTEYKIEDLNIFKKDLNTLFEQYKDDEIILKEYSDLRIKKMQYASPGLIDILGIKDILREIIDLIKYYIPNKKEKIEREILETDLMMKRITFFKEIGLENSKIQQLIFHYQFNLKKIIRLIETKKISDINLEDVYSNDI